MKKNKINRRHFLKAAISSALAGTAFTSSTFAINQTIKNNSTATKPNVLFISVDDLNDYISPLGGYEGKVHTPNFERLAKMGVTFRKAFCTAPVCGSSRSSIMSGLLPARTQLMNQQNIFYNLEHPGSSTEFDQAYNGGINFSVKSLSQAVKDVMEPDGNGGNQSVYATYGTGKLLHQAGFHSTSKFDNCRIRDGVVRWNSVEDYIATTSYFDKNSWDEYQEIDFSMKNQNEQVDLPEYDKPFKKYLEDGAPIFSEELCRGQNFKYNIDPAYDGNEDRMVDQLSVDFAVNKLQTQPANSPMFLGVGLYRPHAPFIVPKKYYDMYPLSEVKIPSYTEEEVLWSKLPHIAKHSIRKDTIKDLASSPNQSLSDIWEDAAQKMYQGYLASMSYADDMLGKLLDAVEARNAQHQDKTVIILWSDHGWHLGEKLGWKKSKLWDKSARIPFFIADPDGAQGVVCDRVVSSIDIYPTVMDYVTNGVNTNVTTDGVKVDGQSIRALVENPSKIWNYGAITSFGITTLGDGHDSTPVQCPPSGVVDVESHCENGVLFTTDTTISYSHSIRTNRWRYVLHDTTAYKHNGNNHTFFEELYDHVNDPGERNNLLFGTNVTKEHSQIRRMFNQVLVKRLNLNDSYSV